jgi:pimeloyl-ACP methyl ester carboxylesterase
VVDLPRDDLERRTSTIGYSMGTAVALEFAARHPVNNVVLLPVHEPARHGALTVPPPFHQV